MSEIIPVVILILSMLIFALMQLVPGTFSLFYHYALGRTTPKTAANASLVFISGAESFVVLVWFLVYSILLTTFSYAPTYYINFFCYILAGVFIALAIASLVLYYRKGHSTALFIPRRTALAMRAHAATTPSRCGAFLLGFCAGLPELLFTLPIYLISAITLLNMTALPRALFITFYVIASLVPLLLIRLAYRTGQNLAVITQNRAHVKPFIRFLLCLLYCLLAILTVNLGVING